jgi:hypothetical protein
MPILPYILLFVFFVVTEYLAIMVSSFQLKTILNKWAESRNFVYQKPSNPLKVFLPVQKSLLFLSCTLTICFSFYLKTHYKFHPQYVLLAIAILKFFDFLKKGKMKKLQKDEELDMFDAYRDDFDAFVTSWRSNLFIQIITLTIGGGILIFM